MSEPSRSAKQSPPHFVVICKRRYSLDKAGYLLNADDWTKEFAEYMAANEALTLNADCWQLIDYAREYFFRYDDSPPMRSLVKWATKALGREKGSSRYLYRLFPAGPGKQVSMLAGLPKPVSCI